MAFLTITNISKKYQNRIILNNINLSFNLNEFVCIVGPSGCGKTTLLSIIGLIETSDTGSIYINEEKIRKYDKARYDYIGFVFQNYHLIPYFDVEKNITLGDFFHNQQDLTKLLEELELLGKQKYMPSMLSGGEQQRVAIARTLYKEPKIILADEPTGALDSKNADKVMRLLRTNNEGRLIIVVTHNEELALKYATRIIRINESKIIEDEVIRTSPEINWGEPTIPYKKQSFKALLTNTIKSYKKRKKTPFTISIIALICFICILATFSLNYGLNKYSAIISNIKLDAKYFEFDYYENEICTENTQELESILKSKKINFLTYDNYNFLLNNFIKPQLGIDKNFSFSVIDFNLINNYQKAFLTNNVIPKNVIINDLFKSSFPSLTTIDFKKDFIILDQIIHLDEVLLLDSVINEGSIYNTPKIYLNYHYVKQWFSDNFNNYFFKIQKEFVISNYLLILSDINSCISFLKDHKLMHSLLTIGQIQEDGYFIYNSSSLILKETFDNLILSIKQLLLIAIVIILVSTISLLGLILSYSLKERTLEIALLQSFGAQKNDMQGIIFCEALILVIPSAATSLGLHYGLSKLCYHNSPSILNQDWFFNFMPFETLGITAVFFVSMLICIIATFLTYKSFKNNSIKGVLQDE